MIVTGRVVAAALVTVTGNARDPVTVTATDDTAVALVNDTAHAAGNAIEGWT